MRIIFLTGILVMLVIKADSQIERSKSLPPDSILLEEVNALVNSYKLAVIKAARCDSNKMDSLTLKRVLRKFTKNAIIEVSSVTTGKKRDRPVEDYFSRLINLCKAMNYDFVDVNYLPDSAPAGIQIIRQRNFCIVDKKITQRFVAYRKKEQVYCDITIRKIHIEFFIQSDNTYKALITKVSVDTTENCGQ